ncbi:MAG TPA: hypothetical protein VFV32_07745 [Acidimicrobiales bacterium]|nr:hypothetical protein [Acidimicrobiales bacterium]
MPATRRPLAFLAGLALSAAPVAGCGDDSPEPAANGSAIADVERWCDVVGEVDGLAYLAEIASDTLAERQARYQDIQRLSRQLQDGVGVVDADVRDDVAAAIGWSVRLADTVVAARTEAELAAAVEPVYYEAPDTTSALRWVEDRCGVVLDD